MDFEIILEVDDRSPEEMVQDIIEQFEKLAEPLMKNDPAAFLAQFEKFRNAYLNYYFNKFYRETGSIEKSSRKIEDLLKEAVERYYE